MNTKLINGLCKLWMNSKVDVDTFINVLRVIMESLDFDKKRDSLLLSKLRALLKEVKDVQHSFRQKQVQDIQAKIESLLAKVDQLQNEEEILKK